MTAPLVLGAPSPAFAQEDEATRARAAFDRGTRKFQARRYDQALEAFQEAYDIRPHPAVLFNIASCYDRLDRAVDAVNAYRRYLRERGEDVEPARRRDVDSALERLTPQVATLHVVPASPDVPVTIDGQPADVGDDPVAVEPGAHVVASTSPDGREAREEVTALIGETTEVTLSFPPLEDAGNDGGHDDDTSGPQGPTTPPRAGGWSPTLRWVGIGATVAFAAGWAFTGLQALSINSDYEKNPDPDTRNRGLTYRTLADFVFLPGTILAAGFTVAAFILARDDDETGPARTAIATPVVLPAIGPDEVSLSFATTF